MPRQQRCFRLITFLLFVSVTFLPAYGQDASLSGFDDYVNRALREWEVPGLAITIVKDDRIVMAKGCGVRKLGDPTMVNERTLLAIGLPVAANRLSIEGAPAGFFIQFEMAEGKVISLTLVQGSGPSLVLFPKQ